MKKIIVILLTFSILHFTCKQDKVADTDSDVIDTQQEIAAINKGNVEFNTYFENKTMRLDYFHTGTATEENFAIDRILSDGKWGGSTKVLIDELELGL